MLYVTIVGNAVAVADSPITAENQLYAIVNSQLSFVTAGVREKGEIRMSIKIRMVSAHMNA